MYKGREDQNEAKNSIIDPIGMLLVLYYFPSSLIGASFQLELASLIRADFCPYGCVKKRSVENKIYETLKKSVSQVDFIQSTKFLTNNGCADLCSNYSYMFHNNLVTQEDFVNCYCLVFNINNIILHVILTN